MADEDDRAADLDGTVHDLVEYHVEHERKVTRVERRLDALRLALAGPRFILTLAIATIGWIVLNSVLALGSIAPLDPPPFFWLQGAVSLVALCTTILILTTQRREDEIATSRQKLMLELAVLSERKSAKIIELLEALRRDHPEIEDRRDDQAGAMAKPISPREVLEGFAGSSKA